MYHGSEAAFDAEKRWVSEVSHKNLAQDIHTVQIGSDESIVDLIARLDIVKSRGEARRLIKQNAVKINNNRVNNENATLINGDILHVGKKHAFKVSV